MWSSFFSADDYDDIEDPRLRQHLRDLRVAVRQFATLLLGNKDIDHEGIVARLARLDRQLRWLMGGVGILVIKAAVEALL